MYSSGVGVTNVSGGLFPTQVFRSGVRESRERVLGLGTLPSYKL